MSIRTALMEMAKPKTERATWVPEAILDDDVADFMGAAAAAKKAGKKEFEFGGKKYKVTMKDKTADAISEESCPECGPDGECQCEEPVKEALDAKDTDTVKTVVKALKGASKAHAGQAKDLQKSLDDSTNEEMDPTDHVKYNDEMKMYCVYDKDGKVVAKFEDEKEANAYAIKNHDALMGREESVEEAAAPGSTAQHGPDDATRDTYQKQMGAGENSIPTSKKEDIVNQHTAEVALDAEAVYKQNQEEAEKAVKQGAGRLGDQRKGDTSFVNPVKSEIIDGITKALQQMKTNS